MSAQPRKCERFMTDATASGKIRQAGITSKMATPSTGAPIITNYRSNQDRQIVLGRNLKTVYSQAMIMIISYNLLLAIHKKLAPKRAPNKWGTFAVNMIRTITPVQS